MKKTQDETYGWMVGYARVSTAEQRLDLQLDALRAAGVKEDNLYVEKPMSATSKKKPALDMAIMDLRPGDTMVVWRLDRIARNIRELYARLDEIAAKGAGLKSLTESFDFSTATGKLILGFLALMAEFERQLTIERTKAGMAALKARGKTLGAARALTDAKVAQAERMLKCGISGPDVAKEFGVAPSTIYAYFTVKRVRGKTVVKRKRK